MAWISGISWVTSLRCPPVSDTAQRDPVPLGDQVVLRTRLAPVNRARPGSWAALQRAQVRAVNHRPGPVQRPGGVQLGQQRLMQMLPDPGLVPVPQAPPARHPGAEPQLL